LSVDCGPEGCPCLSLSPSVYETPDPRKSQTGKWYKTKGHIVTLERLGREEHLTLGHEVPLLEHEPLVLVESFHCGLTNELLHLLPGLWNPPNPWLSRNTSDCTKGY
jgi:hypothetical protein